MSRRFMGLTPAQSDTLGRIMFGMEGRRHPKTLKALAARGLIVPFTRSLGRARFGEIEVTDYDVPLAVNMAYCEWCSEQENHAAPTPQTQEPR